MERNICLSILPNQDMLLYNVTSARGFTAQFCQHLENALRDMMSTMMAAESKL